MPRVFNCYCITNHQHSITDLGGILFETELKIRSWTRYSTRVWSLACCRGSNGMKVSGKGCEKRGSRWASRSSKEAERAANLDFILDVSNKVRRKGTGRSKLESITVNKNSCTWSVISSTLKCCYMLTKCFCSLQNSDIRPTHN